MESKKVSKRKSKKVNKVAETKVFASADPKNNSQKSEKPPQKKKAEPKNHRSSKMVPTDIPVSKKKPDKKIVKKTGNASENKSEIKRKKISNQVAIGMTMSVPNPDQTRIEPIKSKTVVKNIIEKKVRKATQKKNKEISKKGELPLDNGNKSGIIAANPKVGKIGRSRSKPIHAVDDDDDFKEGQKPKRKQREKKKKASDYATEYQFKDSIDDPTGDARADFETNEPDEERYIWCPKRECRIFRKICGLYVKPACLKKTRCAMYDYGMTIKNKYNLKTLEDPKKEAKKKGGDGEDTDNENGDMADIE